MRSMAVLGLCTLVLTGCGHHESSTNLPARQSNVRIPLLETTGRSGSLARLPCPKRPVSTLEIGNCLIRQTLVLNRVANRRIRTIWRIYGGDHLGLLARERFAQSEQAWKGYVEAACTSRSNSWIDPRSPHVYVGGTSAPLNFQLCVQRLTSAHTRELDSVIRDLCLHAADNEACRRGE